MTQSQIQAIREEAYRAGYGDGADAMQLERARKPWLTEDEALAEFMRRDEELLAA